MYGYDSSKPKFIHAEIKIILNSGNACYHLVQNILSSQLLSKDIKIKTYKTIILPVVLYGCETWSLTLRKKHRLTVFENRVLKKISGPNKAGENCIMTSFITCMVCQV
jgi:hypothetical protein